MLQPRNILVILNPFAGDQNGETKFNKIIKPMFDLAEIHYTVMRTSKYVAKNLKRDSNETKPLKVENVANLN